MTNSEKTRKINCIRSIVSVVLALAVFFSAGAAMSVKALAAKTDKAGFSTSTEITMKDYKISVPTYWASDIYDAEEYRAYVTDETFAMLIIDVLGDMEGVSFADELQRNAFIQAMLIAMDSNSKLLESGYKTFGTNEGAYAVFNATIEGIAFKGTLFAMTDNNIGYCFILTESPDNNYDYQPDFLKIVESAKK